MEVTLIGLDLPTTYPERELTVADNWPEQGVALRCFRGKYQDFVEVAAYSSADVIVLSNPSLGGSDLVSRISKSRRVGVDGRVGARELRPS
eukprot:3712701-Amphidinium_carterae.1